MRLRRPAAIVAACLALACFGTVAQEYVGDETCEPCHEDTVKGFARTPHAIVPGWDESFTCETCHGPGSEHVEAGGDVDRIVRPGELPATLASKACLNCHKRQKQHLSYEQSIHYLGDVACNDCHDPHSSAENMLATPNKHNRGSDGRRPGSDALRPGRALCGSCHRIEEAQFDLARTHPLGNCSDCHDPHATRSLRSDATLYREVCIDCHFEKRGPFIYEHDVIMVDGCVSCHEVHGTPNRHLLTHQTQVNLCYECHSASVTLGWHDAGRFTNEKCTACHTAIHGSNTSSSFLEE